MKKPSAILTTLLVALLAAGSAMGATRTWDGGGSDDNWDTAANWVGDVEPVAIDTVNFRTLAIQSQVEAEVTTANTITLLRMGGRGLVTHTTTPKITVKTGGTLTVTDDIHLGYALVGDAGAASANLVVDGGTLAITDQLNIGNVAGAGNANDSTGTLTINSGTVTFAGVLKLATENPAAIGASTGSLIVNGGSLTSSSTAVQYVGQYGDGTLTVDGGTVSFAAAISIKLADQAGSTGTLNLFDGVLTAKTLTVGAGDASVVLDQGTALFDGFRTALFAGYASDGLFSAIGGLADDSALAAQYSTGAGSYTNGSNIIKWGYDSASGKTALWSVILKPEPHLSLIIVAGSILLAVRRRMI